MLALWKYSASYLINGVATQFPESQLNHRPIVNFNFIAESRSEISFYPNSDHELEFYPILTNPIQFYVILCPKF